MQFRGDKTDLLLDLPNRLTRSAPPAKQPDVIGIGLGIVGRDQTEQSGFARPVRTAHAPSFALSDLPVDLVEDRRFSIADGDVLHAYDNRSIGFFDVRVDPLHLSQDRRIEQNHMPVFCWPERGYGSGETPLPALQPSD